ncbi:uncharacterized protein LOC127787597 [Diospyros lotus]|uniref:uncharacterized protein LOC127787597 n=1 Tax=Diospyros lotus TaxID=55363 RepID=UPI0022548C03|nr:uncharacterized protein LOC127787597 [Diospyros lotus]
MNRVDGSWEEQAFADDAAGPMGGFVWPPRSYSCSFCRKEFRSAQALGGHMNIHRRDRARLKQSVSPQNEKLLLLHPQNHNLHACISLVNDGAPYASLEQLKDQLTHTCTPSGSNNYEAASARLESGLDSRTASGKILGRQEHYFTIQGHHDCAETNLSMGSNLAISHNKTCGFEDDDGDGYGDGDVVISNKRHKTTAVSSKERLGFRKGCGEDSLDLELRLGDPPKV